MKSLAVKYRPASFSDVTEQGSIKVILRQQLDSGDLRNAYLFVGSAGCGKTTCARIFANEINRGQGIPIEMDAASHNSVEDVRDIIKMAQSASITSTYKIFIIDECHSLSNQAWQAMLKLIEEPPARAIFIFCTTDPQKIPKTILSRVQRYNFSKISQQGIVDRLKYILGEEYEETGSTHGIQYEVDAVEYIAKLADGGMRDAITMMDKCLAYSTDLTVENVVEALNVASYDDFIGITNLLLDPSDRASLISRLDEIYASGIDIKQFIKSYLQFILDVNKKLILESLDDTFKYTSLPRTKELVRWLNAQSDMDFYNALLRTLVKLDADIKYSQNPKCDVDATFLLFEV